MGFILINHATPPSLTIKRTAWTQRVTGLLVPLPPLAAPLGEVSERGDPPPARRPGSLLMPRLVTFRDWLNAAGTLISALAAVLALAFAYVAQQDQQKSEAARRQAEQMLIAQQESQAVMQAQLASLEAKNLSLQQQMLSREDTRRADQIRGEATLEPVPR